jgi:DNA-binding transcriptional ArsR family regulator
MAESPAQIAKRLLREWRSETRDMTYVQAQEELEQRLTRALAEASREAELYLGPQKTQAPRRRTPRPEPARRAQKPPGPVAGRQRAIRDVIATYTARQGFPPSLRDISAATGLSISNVHYHLDQLVEKGLVRYTPGVPRSYVVIEQPQNEV